MSDLDQVTATLPRVSDSLDSEMQLCMIRMCHVVLGNFCGGRRVQFRLCSKKLSNPIQ